MRRVTPFDARGYYYYYGSGATDPMRRGSLVGGFNPLSLSPSGFWLPEPQYLFEEEDGTGTITATEAVGYVTDQSGNGSHLVQATAGARPTYQTSGGLHWLQSATNDFMAVARTRAQPWERVSAWRILTLAAATVFAGGNAANNFGALYIDAGGTEIRMFAAAELTGHAAPAQDVDFVVTERWNGASSRIAVDNGSYVTGDPGAGTSGALTLFSNGDGATQFIIARCYGIFERDGATLTDAQIGQLRSYFAARQGRVL